MYSTNKIGRAIEGLRLEFGLKQNTLSNMLNMTQGNLCNCERGLYGPGLDTLCRIADIFNVTTDYILGRTGYRCPPEALEQDIIPGYRTQHIVNLLSALDEDSLDAAAKFTDFLKP